jgi:hypothetical protein
MPFESLAKVKQYAERVDARMKTFREKNEQAIERGFQIVEVNGALFGWGFVNEKWGALPHGADASALKEVTIAGVPVDLAAGAALLGVGLFGGLGKYGEHGINLGNGSVGAFASRMGAELGRKSVSTTATTAGAPQMTAGAARVGPQGGRVHTVHYAQP